MLLVISIYILQWVFDSFRHITTRRFADYFQLMLNLHAARAFLTTSSCKVILVTFVGWVINYYGGAFTS